MLPALPGPSIQNREDKWNGTVEKTNQAIERENILDAKRKVIKDTTAEVTLAQLRQEMLAGNVFNKDKK